MTGRNDSPGTVAELYEANIGCPLVTLPTGPDPDDAYDDREEE